MEFWFIFVMTFLEDYIINNFPDVDDCTTGLCQNGGTCMDTGVNSFDCNCTGTGYEGDICADGKSVTVYLNITYNGQIFPLQ